MANLSLRRFDKDPRFQRAVQKLAELTPDQRAIVNTLKEDTEFASEEIRNKIKLMDLAAFRDKAKKDLSLQESKFEISDKFRRASLGLQESAFKSEQAQLPTANLIGLLNVGAAGLLGFGRKRIDDARARRVQTLINQQSARIR